MSLSETVVKPVRCPKCDAEIRDGSAFCYNCGGRVVEENAVDKVPVISPSAPEEMLSKPAPGLRTARDIRRRERTVDRKPKEVVWEPAAAGPDLQLIIATVGIIIFTVIVVLMVLYLR
jgi:hypothetical protein